MGRARANGSAEERRLAIAGGVFVEIEIAFVPKQRTLAMRPRERGQAGCQSAWAATGHYGPALISSDQLLLALHWIELRASGRSKSGPESTYYPPTTEFTMPCKQKAQ